jgi:hypothetical protein
VTVHISGLLAIEIFLFECSPDALIPDISFFFVVLLQIQNTLPLLHLFIPTRKYSVNLLDSSIDKSLAI